MAIIGRIVREHRGGISLADLTKHVRDHPINSFELGLAVATLRGRGQLKVLKDGSIRI